MSLGVQLSLRGAEPRVAAAWDDPQDALNFPAVAAGFCDIRMSYNPREGD